MNGPDRKKIAANYFFAIVVICLAAILQWILRATVSIAVFIILYPAVFIIAWTVGFGPSLLAIFISVLFALSLFAPSPSTTPNDLARVGIFLIGSILVSWVVARGRRAEDEVRRAVLRDQQTRETLKENEERFRLAQSVARIGTFDWNIRSGLVQWTAELEAMYGLAKGGLGNTEKIWENLIFPEDRNKTLEGLQQALQGSGEFKNEWRIHGSKGTLRWIAGRTHVFKDPSGRPLRLIGIHIDITEQKRAEEERATLLQREKEARAQAEKAVQLRDEFIAIASHELKTPMTPLKLQAQVIARRWSMGKTLEEDAIPSFIKLVDRQVDQLVRLVDDMLDISRIATGQLSMDIANFNLSELVSKVTKRLIQLHPKEAPIHLETEAEIYFQGDANRIEQVLTNLLSNAFKYGEGKPIQVKLVKKGPHTAQLSVKDQGLGISAQDRQRIFERFERAVSASHISGLGVGLYLANQIARAHHGVLRVESESGRGSVFILELPLRQTS